MAATLGIRPGERQLILIGHGGTPALGTHPGGRMGRRTPDRRLHPAHHPALLRRTPAGKPLPHPLPGRPPGRPAGAWDAGRLASCVAVHGRYRWRMGYVVRLPRRHPRRYRFSPFAGRRPRPEGSPLGAAAVPAPVAPTSPASVPARQKRWPAAPSHWTNASPSASWTIRRAPSLAWPASPARWAVRTATTPASCSTPTALPCG